MIKGLASIKEGKDFLHVSYEDFEVEQFGGGDYEVNYSLDGQNKEKLSLPIHVGRASMV